MEDILPYLIIGFAAQLIDGSMGMGYKTSTTTLLLSAGVPPLLASSSVHTAGVFTSAASGYAHWRIGTPDRSLILRLAVPGIVGGIAGAVLLNLTPVAVIKPLVALYLMVMGLCIVLKSLKRLKDRRQQVDTRGLGMFGGFFDAVGGGGWGPIVTSTLVVNGHDPRSTISAVNIAEFFVTAAQAATFVAVLAAMDWAVIVGLIIGGVIAAPIAAYISQHLPVKRLMLLVGLLIMALSARTLFLSITGG